MSERMNPRQFAFPVDVVARHIDRYLSAVKLLDLQPSPDTTCFNFGCGERYTSEILANFFGHIYAFDAEQSGYGQSDERITYLATPDDGLPPYDAIFCIEVIEHLVCPDLLLRELHKFGDTLLISTPIVAKTTCKPTNPYHKIEWSLKDFVEMIEMNDWKITATDARTTVFTNREKATQGIFLARAK